MTVWIRDAGADVGLCEGGGEEDDDHPLEGCPQDCDSAQVPGRHDDPGGRVGQCGLGTGHDLLNDAFKSVQSD